MAESGYNLISRHPKVVLGDAATWRQSEWTLDMEIMGIMTQIKECNKSKYWATKPRNKQEILLLVGKVLYEPLP